MKTDFKRYDSEVSVVHIARVIYAHGRP